MGPNNVKLCFERPAEEAFALNGMVVYDDVYVKPEEVYSMTGSDYHAFAPPISLKGIYATPIDYALLLRDYIRLDGSKELLNFE